VVILGAAIVDGRPPEKIDASSDFIMIEGVAPSDIKPEQLLIQQTGKCRIAQASLIRSR